MYNLIVANSEFKLVRDTLLPSITAVALPCVVTYEILRIPICSVPL